MLSYHCEDPSKNGVAGENDKPLLQEGKDYTIGSIKVNPKNPERSAKKLGKMLVKMLHGKEMINSPLKSIPDSEFVAFRIMNAPRGRVNKELDVQGTYVMLTKGALKKINLGGSVKNWNTLDRSSSLYGPAFRTYYLKEFLDEDIRLNKPKNLDYLGDAANKASLTLTGGSTPIPDRLLKIDPSEEEAECKCRGNEFFSCKEEMNRIFRLQPFKSPCQDMIDRNPYAIKCEDFKV